MMGGAEIVRIPCTPTPKRIIDRLKEKVFAHLTMVEVNNIDDHEGAGEENPRTRWPQVPHTLI